MREIKFRAWDKKENRWYQPVHEASKGKLHELFVAFGGQLVAHTLNGINHESIFPDRYIVQRYTGLKDKNGKDIYEGDIVKTSESSVTTYEVIFTRGGFAINFKDGHRYLGQFSDLIAIGNIYQNLELLKGE